MAKEIKSEYNVIGVMAGSSMDGLDLARASFSHDEKWTFELLDTEMVSYDEKMLARLRQSPRLSKGEQLELDEEFGHWIAEKVQEFSDDHTDIIAVHGHTVIHKPQEGISWQLGDGKIIAHQTGITTVSNFRSQDVELRGQGAPLVPVGDFELFSDFDACLNLGGIANASVAAKKIAWDICPCNQVLNYYASQLGQEFDRDGDLARNGKVDDKWVEEIGRIPFFSETEPKSLPNNFLKKELLDIVAPEVGLSSYTTFIAQQIVNDLNKHLGLTDRVLVTGGGAFNTYLVELLNRYSEGTSFIVPSQEIVTFKEALIFGFLGVLRMRDETNVLASVTGSKMDSCSGQIHLAK